ncbi:hypothetical protein L873DRAFT_1793700 [Choiromyces venosus 120613-1]|uniref:Uncharacterized protein n=1 Tax=Choiromyces venosus 120613-1 TaxID=1336337 RepID=A0A3N4J7U7_9PEZI|nr:hypothetical protein L873DRAFT_1793700 [Choiromyces venosus 120613-1]
MNASSSQPVKTAEGSTNTTPSTLSIAEAPTPRTFKKTDKLDKRITIILATLGQKRIPFSPPLQSKPPLRILAHLCGWNKVGGRRRRRGVVNTIPDNNDSGPSRLPDREISTKGKESFAITPTAPSAAGRVGKSNLGSGARFGLAKVQKRGRSEKCELKRTVRKGKEAMA